MSPGFTLAIDTSAALGGVGLVHGTELVAARELGPPGAQAETLLVAIDDLLHETNLDLSRIDLLAVALGPGSFPGLRIGLAAAQGIGAGRGIPVVGVPTSTLRMAWARLVSEDRGSAWVAVLDARRREVFLAEGASSADDPFDVDVRSGPDLVPLGEVRARLEPAARDASPARPLVLCGEGVPLVAATINELAAAGGGPVGLGRFRTVSPPRPPDAARLLGLLGRRHWARDGDPALLEPLYVREPDARKPANPVHRPPEAR
jgi:tRNA threonylcarbamoyladenosine biosynthesis protein TsaB